MLTKFVYSTDSEDGVASTNSIATSSNKENGIKTVTSLSTDASSDTEHGVISTPQDASVSEDVTSATNTIGSVSIHTDSDASIDSGSGSVINVITGVIIAIIVLGILPALVVVVLFMKARYSILCFK